MALRALMALHSMTGLINIVSWADEWQLSVSVKKCCVLHISKTAVTSQFYVNDKPLPLVSSYRDLGITISNDLSPGIRGRGR